MPEATKPKMGLGKKLGCGCLGIFLLMVGLAAIGGNNSSTTTPAATQSASVSASPVPTTTTSPIIETSAPTPSPVLTPTQTTKPTPVSFSINDLIGQKMKDIETKYNVKSNEAGNLLWEDENYKFYVEPKVDYVEGANGIKKAVTRDVAGFVEIGVKSLGVCKADQSILKKVDSALTAVDLDPSKKGSPTNPASGINIGAVSYANYPGEWVVGVTCYYDGALTSVSLSTRQ